MKRLLILLAGSCLLGAGANAVSPRGLSWTRPLGRGIGPDVAAAGFTPVDLHSMLDLVRNGAVLPFDARTEEEYRIGRLPGARRTVTFPSDGRPIVVYCSNEFCDRALQVAQDLRKRGFSRVAVFVDGYEAWWNAGGPVDQD